MNADYIQWKHWKEAQFGRCSEQAGKYFSWHVGRAFPEHPSRLNVLELGFGNGEFLAYCRSQGFTVTGVEIDARLVDRARAAGYAALKTPEEASAAGPFDLIAAFDVLEHLGSVELQQFFGSLDTMLAQDGCLIARVPNGDSPFGRRHQHGDLTHLTTFGEFKLRQIAHCWRLSVVGIGEAPWYVDEFERPSIKSLVRGGLKMVIELIFGFVFYRKWVCLDPNLVVVLKKSSGDLIS